MNEKALQVDNEKIAPILDYPTSRNLKQLRRFYGMSSWYRRFIQDYATLAAQQSFEIIRQKLTEAPILKCPDFKVPFELQTDARNTGVGAVLTQTEDGIEYVISFASRVLTEPEKNYSVTEK